MISDDVDSFGASFIFLGDEDRRNLPQKHGLKCFESSSWLEVLRLQRIWVEGEKKKLMLQLFMNRPVDKNNYHYKWWPSAKADGALKRLPERGKILLHEHCDQRECGCPAVRGQWNCLSVGPKGNSGWASQSQKNVILSEINMAMGQKDQRYRDHHFWLVIPLTKWGCFG